MKNDKGYYVYAEKKNGKLMATSRLAHDEAARSEAEQAYLATAKKYLKSGRFVWNVRPNRRKRSTAPPWKRAVRRRRSEPRREAPCCRRPEQLFLRERSCKHACDRPSQLHPNREGS